MKKAKTNRKETIGKYLLDISKLTFASFILGGILLGGIPQYIIIALGFVVTIVTFILGVQLTTKSDESKE